MLKLARFLKEYKAQVVLGPLFKLFEAILELLLPMLMARLIDDGIKALDKSVIVNSALLMLLMATLGLGCALVCQYMASVASQGFGTALRNALFKKITTFSHNEYEKFGAASLTNRVTGDINQLQLAVAMVIRLLVRAPFLCVGAAVAAVIIDPFLALIILLFMPAFALVLYLIMRKAIPLHRQVQKKLDRLAVILRESLGGVRVIRAFAREDKQVRRFEQTNEDMTKIVRRAGVLSALLNPATTLLMNAAVAGILWFGGARVNIGGLSQGNVIAFINYVTQILLALIVVANLVIIFSRASVSAERVNEVLATEPSVATPEGAVEFLHEAPAVEFSSVTFGYGDKPAIENISLTVPRGAYLGIIGGTGSGKSTLINLIPRFYDPQRGQVKLFGVDAKKIPGNELRKMVAVVPQQIRLFSGTIRDNLLWGNQNATGEELLAACEMAQAHFVDAAALERPVERGGMNFSGGQRQRLCIARALVAKPEILILDDSSSALDFATDLALRRALKALGCTIIAVSQRVSSVREAQQILVLSDGRTVGLGTHETLLKECEAYRAINRLETREA